MNGKFNQAIDEMCDDELAVLRRPVLENLSCVSVTKREDYLRNNPLC